MLLKKITQIFKKPEIISPFNLVYTDTKGNKWYALKNPANLCAERALAAWAFKEDSRYSLTRDNLKGILARMNDAVNKGDMATISKSIGVIESALDLYCTEEILLNIATVYTFLESEENTGIQDYITERKRQIWRDDVSCRSFFLQFAYPLTASYSELPELNVLTYLSQMQPLLNHINSQMKRAKSRAKG